jgi:two-component system, NtrC family, response regulator PilR
LAVLLIVDDEEGIRDALYDLFEEEHRCHTAGTAEQAIKWLDAEEYDVVLTDISMPGLSGIELLGVVRQRQPKTPVIVITGLSDREHAKGLMQMGAFDYMVKPFRLEAVEKSVKRALGHRRLLLGEVIVDEK